MIKSLGLTLEQAGERLAILEKLTATNASELAMLVMKQRRIEAEIELDEEEMAKLRLMVALLAKAKVTPYTVTQDGDSQGGKA